MDATNHARRTGWLRLPIWKKVLFATATTAGLLAALELALACCGLEPADRNDDPFLGFSLRTPHFVVQEDAHGQRMVVVAPHRQATFNPQRFRPRRPVGTYRVFCVGGSTTYGRPFFDSTSMAGWLRVLLPVADPSRRWEVINAGAISYASYRITGVMQELCQYDPDLFVVYTGHNEFLERRTYAAVFNTPPLVRETAALVRRTRTAAAVQGCLECLGMAPSRARAKPVLLPEKVRAIPVNAIGPEAYTRDNPLQAHVVEHFRINLARMIAIATRAGAAILFVTPASNLADFAPFKSEHRPGMSAAEIVAWRAQYEEGMRLLAIRDWSAAIGPLQRAEAIDDRHAALQYHLGYAWLQLREDAQARKHFERARDEDICPLRAITAITDTVRNVASQGQTMRVDFDRFAADHSERGIPGRTFFHDHVHPTIDANRHLALEIIKALASAAIVHTSGEWNQAAVDRVVTEVMAGIDRPAHAAELHKLSFMLEWLGQQDQARRKALEALALSAGSADSLYQVGLLYQRQHDAETAARYYRQATNERPDFPEAHLQFGVALMSLGRADEAIDHLTKAADLRPDFAPAHTKLGVLLTRKGLLERARSHFAQAVALEPESDAAHNNLGLALAHLGQRDEAIRHFRRAIGLNPMNSSAHLNCGMALEGQGRQADAIRCYRQVLRLRPGHQEADTRLRALERR